jgi:glycine/D-amino acid oxidase-like deaminating enzyme
MTRTAVVVGAGVFGLSVARELVFRGWSVRLVDVHCPGSHGPSAAETRILRFSYGDNGRYPALAKRALRMWQELERESGRKLLVPSGVLVLGLPAPDSGAWEQASARQLNRLGIPVEIMGATAAARRFPEFDCQASGTVLFEPWGAILRAKEATLALAESACDRGAELVQAAAHPSDGSALVNGERLQADVTVWAVGSALPTLFPGLTSVREVRQDS